MIIISFKPTVRAISDECEAVGNDVRAICYMARVVVIIFEVH